MTNYWLDLCLKDEYKDEVHKALKIMIGIRYSNYNYMMNAYKQIMADFEKFNLSKYKRVSNSVQIKVLYTQTDEGFVTVNAFNILFLR